MTDDDCIVNIEEDDIIDCKWLELWIPLTEEEKKEIIENKDICDNCRTKRCNDCNLRVYGNLKKLI